MTSRKFGASKLITAIKANDLENVIAAHPGVREVAVFGVADRVLALIDGQLAASGPPDAVAQDDRVRGRYLGHDFGFGSGGGA